VQGELLKDRKLRKPKKLQRLKSLKRNSRAQFEVREALVWVLKLPEESLNQIRRWSMPPIV
jgi:uncharacterized lipoprotein